MNSPAKDVVKILGDGGLGLTPGTDLVFARMPDNTDNIVSTYDGPGDPPMLTLKQSTSDYYYPSVSVRVRNKNYETGYNLMFSIYEYLHGKSNVTIGTTLYTVIRALNDPQLLLYDNNDRPVFMCNFQLQRRATS